jgi:hypothetical protein
VFEAAMVTHQQIDAAVDDADILRQQEMQLEKLKDDVGSLEK